MANGKITNEERIVALAQHITKLLVDDATVQDVSHRIATAERFQGAKAPARFDISEDSLYWDYVSAATTKAALLAVASLRSFTR